MKWIQPFVTTRWSAIALAVVVATAVVIVWVWRDGLDPGDLLGGLVIGLLTFVALVALRAFRGS